MSTAARSLPTSGLTKTVESFASHVVSGVQAAAFWTAALLPLALVVGLFAGALDQRLGAVGGVLLVNVVCALVGHGHSPN